VEAVLGGGGGGGCAAARAALGLWPERRSKRCRERPRCL